MDRLEVNALSINAATESQSVIINDRKQTLSWCPLLPVCQPSTYRAHRHSLSARLSSLMSDSPVLSFGSPKPDPPDQPCLIPALVNLPAFRPQLRMLHTISTSTTASNPLAAATKTHQEDFGGYGSTFPARCQFSMGPTN